MSERTQRRFTGLGVLPLFIPAAVSILVFEVATRMFSLPAPGWAVLTLAFASIWYLWLWLALRRSAQIRTTAPSTEPVRGFRDVQTFRLALGVILLSVGGVLLLVGDHKGGLVSSGVGAVWLLVWQIRRWIAAFEERARNRTIQRSDSDPGPANTAHVTVRVRPGIPSLRNRGFIRDFQARLRRGCERGEFRVCHYSIQRDHVHLVVESAGKEALGRGMKSEWSQSAGRARRRILGFMVRWLEANAAYARRPSA